MATYRVSLKGSNIIDKEAARKVIDSVLGKEINKFKNAGINAMKELRTGAVNAWYGSTALNTMNASTEYFCESVKQNKDTITITITSGVDPKKYESIKKSKEAGHYSIFDWRDKHETSGWSWGKVSNGNPVPMGMSVGEYLIYSQWYLGQRGLPEEETSTGTGWVNPQPHIETPMQDVVQSVIQSGWINTVNKYLKKG